MSVHRPLPKIDDTNRPFWDACRQGRMVLQRCDDPACAKWVFYPRVCCPYCGGGGLGWHDASGRGTLLTCTTIHRPGHAVFMADVPYLFAAIRLDEGPVMYGRLTGPAPLGHPVQALYPDRGDNVVIPEFAPL